MGYFKVFWPTLKDRVRTLSYSSAEKEPAFTTKLLLKASEVENNYKH